MLEGMLLPAGLFLGGIITKYIAGKVPKVWNSFMFKLRKDATEKAKILLKDDEWRYIVTLVALKVQKDLGSEASEAKLKQATEWLKSIIPYNLEDPIIDALVEMIIDEVKKPIDLGSVGTPLMFVK